MALLDKAMLGSSLSLRRCARSGSALSVLDFFQLGSSLAVRSVGRLGAAISICGLARMGSSISVLHVLHICSALSLRSFSRMGSSLSVLDFFRLGASLSIRSYTSLGSSLSVYGAGRLGSALSVYDFESMGSRRMAKRAGAAHAFACARMLASRLSMVKAQPWIFLYYSGAPLWCSFSIWLLADQINKKGGETYKLGLACTGALPFTTDTFPARTSESNSHDWAPISDNCPTPPDCAAFQDQMYYKPQYDEFEFKMFRLNDEYGILMY